MDLNTVTALLPATHPRDARPGDAWLAGGTFLFSEPQPHVARLLDLAPLAWPPLTGGGPGEDLVVAATCTIEALTAWSAGPGSHHRAAPLVGACADAFWAGWKIQAVATVGGNVVTALPAAPMVSLLAALDATATCWAGDGSVRVVAVTDLVTGDHTTALAPGELVRSFTVPAAALAARTAVARTSLTPLGRSAALVVARRDGDDTGAVVLTCTAATRRPVQLRWDARAVLPDDPAAAGAAAADALDAAVPDDLWHDDVHGHPAWRRAMALRLASEVVAEVCAPDGPAPGGPAPGEPR